MKRNKDKIIEKIFNYVLRAASKYNLNVLLSINGDNRIALAGPPDKFYTRLYEKINKQQIEENEYKRMCNIKFIDLFNKLNILQQKHVMIGGMGSRGTLFEIKDNGDNFYFYCNYLYPEDKSSCRPSIEIDKFEEYNKYFHNHYFLCQFQNGSSFIDFTMDFVVDKNNDKLVYLRFGKFNIYGYKYYDPNILLDDNITFDEINKLGYLHGRNKLIIKALSYLIDYKVEDISAK